MKQLLPMCCLVWMITAFYGSNAQTIDTLAFQDFEITPAAPVWTYTGNPTFSSGFSANNAAPPNSPLGVNGSRAWNTTQVSGGVPLDFSNVTIPSGVYDSIKLTFKIAAMNLNGSSGGPDHLDWILVSYSLDGGVNYTNRIRVRGAVNQNSFWPYTAQGQAKAYYLPTTEVMFQPVNSGLQLQDGIAHCELSFPGNISQLAIRITARSSSSTDTWLIDDVVLSGLRNCQNTNSTITQSGCKSITFNGQTYTSSGTYTQTIPNAAGCDSIITLNLNIDTVNTIVTQNGLTLMAQATNATFQWIECSWVNPPSGCFPISGATTSQYTVDRNGAYAAVITQQGCTDTSDFVVVQNVSDDGLEWKPLLLRVSPNPATGSIVIQSPSGLHGKPLRIFNTMGQVILDHTIDHIEQNISVQDWPRGLYFIHVEGQEPLRLLVQ
jgi:hypothetical protein